jgi:small-conductance mechanosensitive channel
LEDFKDCELVPDPCAQLIFIFSTHVFDVGDLVMIDDQVCFHVLCSTITWLIHLYKVLFVKEFGLFSTTFRRVDGQEVIAPNAILASTKLVHNLRRSKSMWVLLHYINVK